MSEPSPDTAPPLVPSPSSAPGAAGLPSCGRTADPTMIGLACAFGAYLIWGLVPIYFKAVATVPPLEVLCHRVLWTVALTGGLALALWMRRRVRPAGPDPWIAAPPRRWRPRWRRIGVYLVTTCLVSTNWLIFIWAIATDRVLEASLGYYINPLVSILLGVVVLGERLGLRRGVAVALAAAGVLVLVVDHGAAPMVSLGLAFSFGAYALVRKWAAVDPLYGLLIETVLLAPFAAGFLAWQGALGLGAFGARDLATDALLAASGLVTGVPLMLFMAAAARLQLSTLGLMQYLAPTCHLVLATAVYGEPFTRAHAATFALIWTALAVASWGALGDRRRRLASASGQP